MKNLFKLIGLIALIAVMATTVACSKKSGAQAGGRAPKEAPASDFNYVAWKYQGVDGVWITSYTGKGGDLVIPATIEDLPVLGLGDMAFQGGFFQDGTPAAGNAITSVVIPESVKRIGLKCFQNNHNLKSVTIMGSEVFLIENDGSVSINSHAFVNCKNLTSVTFMGSPVYIGFYAFDGCENLTELNFPDVDNALVPFTVWGRANDVLANNIQPEDRHAFRNCTKLPLAIRAKLREMGFNIQ